MRQKFCYVVAVCVNCCVRSRSFFMYFAHRWFVFDVEEWYEICYCLIFILAGSRSWTLLGLQDRWKKHSCTPGSKCWNWLSEPDGFICASMCRCALSGTIHLSGKERILQSSCSVYSWGSCWGNVLCHIELVACNWVNNLGALLPVFLFSFSTNHSGQNNLFLLQNTRIFSFKLRSSCRVKSDKN